MVHASGQFHWTAAHGRQAAAQIVQPSGWGATLGAAVGIVGVGLASWITGGVAPLAYYGGAALVGGLVGHGVSENVGGARPALNFIASAIHLAGGGSAAANTTGVARLNDGRLAVSTQIPITPNMIVAAGRYGIPRERIANTKGDGYHTETSLYIDYGNAIVAVGASQGFCPHCQAFLTAKGINMEGARRLTKDQVWRSPEFYRKVEKAVPTDPYPWVFELDSVEGRRIEHNTKVDYLRWYFARTGGGRPVWA